MLPQFLGVVVCVVVGAIFLGALVTLYQWMKGE